MILLNLSQKVRSTEITIWSENLNLYKKYATDNNLLIVSVCDNFSISNGLNKKYLKYFNNLTDR